MEKNKTPYITELVRRIRKTAEELRACPPSSKVETLDSRKVLDFFTFFGGKHV